jgi:hypothetical protein
MVQGGIAILNHQQDAPTAAAAETESALNALRRAHHRRGLPHPRAEIEHLLQKAGATKVDVITERDRATVLFEIHDRRLKLVLTLPTKYPNAAKLEQLRRSRWRALLLCIKAKLESVARGVETFEEAFLAHVVMPGGDTIYEQMKPKLIEIAAMKATVLALSVK